MFRKPQNTINVDENGNIVTGLEHTQVEELNGPSQSSLSLSQNVEIEDNSVYTLDFDDMFYEIFTRARITEDFIPFYIKLSSEEREIFLDKFFTFNPNLHLVEEMGDVIKDSLSFPLEETNALITKISNYIPKVNNVPVDYWSEDNDIQSNEEEINSNKEEDINSDEENNNINDDKDIDANEYNNIDAFSTLPEFLQETLRGALEYNTFPIDFRERFLGLTMEQKDDFYNQFIDSNPSDDLIVQFVQIVGETFE